MKDCGDFRYVGFRSWVLRNLIFETILPPFTFKDSSDLLRILGKDKISDNDLIRIYLILSKIDKVYIDELLFNYKIQTISWDRVYKFLDIIKAKANIFTTDRINYYSLTSCQKHTAYDLTKLVDMFLDEI